MIERADNCCLTPSKAIYGVILGVCLVLMDNWILTKKACNLRYCFWVDVGGADEKRVELRYLIDTGGCSMKICEGYGTEDLMLRVSDVVSVLDCSDRFSVFAIHIQLVEACPSCIFSSCT